MPNNRTGILKTRKTSECSACKMIGHWRGDAECPEVQAGRDRLYVPKNQPRKPDGKPKKTYSVNTSYAVNTVAVNTARPVHWSAMVGDQSVEEDWAREEDVIRVKRVIRNYQQNCHCFKLHFKHQKHVLKILRRHKTGIPIKVKQGQLKEIRVNDEKNFGFIVECPNTSGRQIDEGQLVPVLQKILLSEEEGEVASSSRGPELDQVTNGHSTVVKKRKKWKRSLKPRIDPDDYQNEYEAEKKRHAE